jgi:hypothetical protein
MSSRGQSGSDAQKAAVAQALDVLERSGGISDPALSPLIEGKWQLLYTSKSSFDIKNVSYKRVSSTCIRLGHISRLRSAPTFAMCPIARCFPPDSTECLSVNWLYWRWHAASWQARGWHQSRTGGGYIKPVRWDCRSGEKMLPPKSLFNNYFGIVTLI